MKKLFSYHVFFSSIFLFLLTGCVNPVEPEFDFKEGLIFIDAFASTVPGSSFVTLRESKVNGSRYFTELIENATVTFMNTSSGTVVQLNQNLDSYIPPQDFVVSTGETWQLNVVLPNGIRYSSLPETVLESVPIDAIEAAYDPQLSFRDDSETFVPGHSVSVSFQDPSNDENFYYWRFSSFETLALCAQCNDSAFRDGICTDIPDEIDVKPRFTYLCSNDCWRIRFNENVKVFSDEFTNGSSVNSLPVADVLLYTKENIAIEVQQFSLSASAYRYYKVLSDIVDNSGSFNAPPPAALLGNLFNIDDDQEFVLGRFTAAAAGTATIFVDRTDINEAPIEDSVSRVFESSPNPLINPVTTAECKESRTRTAIEPIGWVDN